MASAHSAGTVGIEWAAPGQRGRSFRYEVPGTAMEGMHDAYGVSGATTYPTNLTITPIEVLESQCPMRLTRFGLIADSGGPGPYRGGSLARMRIRRADGQVEGVPVAGSYELSPHAVLTIEGSGADGCGDPHTRPAELVLVGVRASLVSAQAAVEHYGVVIGERLEIDEPATSIAREESQ